MEEQEKGLQEKEQGLPAWYDPENEKKIKFLDQTNFMVSVIVFLSEAAALYALFKLEMERPGFEGYILLIGSLLFFPQQAMLSQSVIQMLRIYYNEHPRKKYIIAAGAAAISVRPVLLLLLLADMLDLYVTKLYDWSCFSEHIWAAKVFVPVGLAGVVLLAILLWKKLLKKKKGSSGPNIKKASVKKYGILWEEILFSVALAAVVVIFRLPVETPVTEYPDKLLARAGSSKTESSTLETLSLLDGEEWKQLSAEERLTVLCDVLELEMENLGIGRDLWLSMDNMAEFNLGKSIGTVGVIRLNREAVENRDLWENVQSICHEARHIYQYEVSQLAKDLGPRFQNLLEELKTGLVYGENFSHYYSYEPSDDTTVNAESFEQYSSQILESDADSYSSERIRHYMFYTGHCDSIEEQKRKEQEKGFESRSVVRENGRFALRDIEGSPVGESHLWIDFIVETSVAAPFMDENGLLGILNGQTGEVLAGGQYDNYDSYSLRGLFAMKLPEEGGWHLWTRNGKLVLDEAVKDVKLGEFGVAFRRQDGSVSFADNNGDILIESAKDISEVFEEIMVTRDGKTQIYNCDTESKKLLKKGELDRELYYISGYNFILVEDTSGLQGVLDVRSVEMAIEPVYQKINLFTQHADNTNDSYIVASCFDGNAATLVEIPWVNE